MFFMQDGFKLLSGGILEKLLQKFTSNTFYAIITGFFFNSTCSKLINHLFKLLSLFYLLRLLTLVQRYWNNFWFKPRKYNNSMDCFKFRS
ncbi:MAG: hypothetical protein U5K55_13775 [Aliarcobacter sp.]|nr:hypothetical protein [Aliarcobacter sp.]